MSFLRGLREITKRRLLQRFWSRLGTVWLCLNKIPLLIGNIRIVLYLVDVDSFFRTVGVPELQGQDVNAFPMLKVGSDS